MKFFKQNKTPLIPNDGLEVPEESTQEKTESRSDQPKTETAIVKSILLDWLNKRLHGIDEAIQAANNPKKAEFISRDFADEIAVLREMKRLLTSLPDVLYTVHRTNPEVIEIKGLDGSAFELSLSRKVIGGSVYQLKDNGSGQVVEIISSDYLNEVEESCVNGYLFPDEKLSEALAQLGKSIRNEE